MADVIVVGASVRALAASMLREGREPWCIDLFADVDLARRCLVKTISLEDYPQGLPALFDDAPNVPWRFTGGLENYPEILEQIPRPLLGPSVADIRRVRDPFYLAELAARHHLPFPRTSHMPDLDVPMFVKAYRSAGGLGVRLWTAGSEFDPQRVYFQERLNGVVGSALFRGQELLGVSEQLVTPHFAYAGNVTPLSVTADVLETLRVWSRSLNLPDLFGIDFILCDRQAFLLEVNPRYAASYEVIERHRADGRIHGKAIVYAPADFPFPAQGPWLEALERPLESLQVPYADIPARDTPVSRGQPILTVFAEDDCARVLRAKSAEVLRACGFSGISLSGPLEPV